MFWTLGKPQNLDLLGTQKLANANRSALKPNFSAIKR